jgi:predicted HD phosphohydrolase
MTITAADRRAEAADFLERIGCRITASFFDRREGSYSVGRIGQDGYFLPTTWPREEYVLDWVYGHREQVRRGVLGEPVEFALFLEHAVEKAAERAGDDWHMFVAALGNDLDQVQLEAREAKDDEILDLVDDIEGMRSGSPADVLARVREVLGLVAQAPRM